MQVLISVIISLGIIAFFLLSLKGEDVMQSTNTGEKKRSKKQEAGNVERVSRKSARVSAKTVDDAKTKFGSSCIWSLKIYDPESGQTNVYPFDCEEKDIIVGRGTGCDIQIQNLTVSRKAFVLGYDDTVFLSPEISQSTGDYAPLYKVENGKFYKVTEALDVFHGLRLYNRKDEHSIVFEFVSMEYALKTKTYHRG